VVSCEESADDGGTYKKQVKSIFETTSENKTPSHILDSNRRQDRSTYRMVQYIRSQGIALHSPRRRSRQTNSRMMESAGPLTSVAEKFGGRSLKPQNVNYQANRMLTHQIRITKHKVVTNQPMKPPSCPCHRYSIDYRYNYPSYLHRYHNFIDTLLMNLSSTLNNVIQHAESDLGS
jgi:hypothetical protein